MIRGEIEDFSSTLSSSHTISVGNLASLYNSSISTSTSTSTADDMSDTGSLIFDEDLTDLVSLTQDEIILKKERIRQQTVTELVKTEANYVRDLKLITKLYIEPIRGHIDQRQYHEVFGCTEGLLNYHRDIIHSLEGIPSKPPHLQNVGEILYKYFDNLNYLNLYKEFCSYQNTCNESFEKLKLSSKIFYNCIEGASKSHLTRGLSFPMLIIKPIQRITKYPLLLKSLLENTPTDHMDYRYIKFCYLKINEILEEVNHQKRLADERVDNEKKVREIESSLQNLDDLKLVNTTRKFIKEGLVSKKLDKELLRCILLNDILILAKNKKSNSTVKLIIHLENILIRDSIDSLPGYKEGFEILVLNEKKEKIIGLYFSSEAEKKEWLAAIQSLSGGNIDQQKQNKYSWFLKKNSGTFLSTTSSLSSLSSSTLSIDISMSPSPRSSMHIQGTVNNSVNGNGNGNTSNGSGTSSPSLESPSYRTQQQNQQVNRDGGKPQPISLNSITPNGSLRETRKPPPPPSAKDIFGSLGREGNGMIKMGPPYSTNPSPNGTLTHSAIDSISPTIQSTVPSSSNFSRASSVPSFYNLQNDQQLQQLNQQQQLQLQHQHQHQQNQQQQQQQSSDTKHNARRMPQTISSIPQSEDSNNKLSVRPTPPPRNPSPYNTISEHDYSNYSSASSGSLPISAPSSGFNTPLSSSCDYVPIKNGTGSKSFTNLLPPPPPLVLPTLPPPPPILPATPSIDFNSLPPPPPPSSNELQSATTQSQLPRSSTPTHELQSTTTATTQLPPPPPPRSSTPSQLSTSPLPPPIDFNNLPPPPPPRSSTPSQSTTLPLPPPILNHDSILPPPPTNYCLPPPPPPIDDDDIHHFAPISPIPPQLPPKTFLNNDQPPPTNSSPVGGNTSIVNKMASNSNTPPPQTTPPSTLRAKSPVNKPAIVPRAKSPATITISSNNDNKINSINKSPSTSFTSQPPASINHKPTTTKTTCNILPPPPTILPPSTAAPLPHQTSFIAFKKANSEACITNNNNNLPPPPLVVKSVVPPRAISSSNLPIPPPILSPPPPLASNNNNNNNNNTTTNNTPIPPPISLHQAPINSNSNLINKQQTAFKPLTKSTGITMQGRTTPPMPLSLPPQLNNNNNKPK